jgi:hypothetical protein
MISHLSNCARRWHADAVCTCQPSEERVRAEYRGAQLLDCGSVLRVRFTENPTPKGLRAKPWATWRTSFEKEPRIIDGEWVARGDRNAIEGWAL